jgi:hypothetical protein
MKKLTKTLSLVLVIAMVVSLCVVGASAKTFSDYKAPTDKTATDYTEAIDVMSGIGIIDGMNGRQFRRGWQFHPRPGCQDHRLHAARPRYEGRGPVLQQQHCTCLQGCPHHLLGVQLH